VSSADGYEIATVKRALLNDYWYFVHDWLEAALKGTPEISMKNVYMHVHDGRWIMLVATRQGKLAGCAVAEIATYPDGKMFNIVAMGGKDFSEWSDIFDEALVGQARQYRCPVISAYIRDGLMKEARKHGYVKRSNFVIKEVT
jgi:hypothetical protein